MSVNLREILGGSIAEMLGNNGNGGAQVIDLDANRWTEGQATIADLVFDAQYQMRVEHIDDVYVKELRERLSAGEDLGEIEIRIVNGRWYVTDGWQRTEAHKREGYTQIAARWRVSTHEEAKDAAYLANTRHGKQLNDADKHHKLKDACARWRDKLEKGEMTVTALARKTGLTISFVHRHSSKYVTLPAVRMVERNGQQFWQNTEHIGRPPKAAPVEEDDAGDDVLYDDDDADTPTQSAPARSNGGGGSGAARSATKNAGASRNGGAQSASREDHVSFHVPASRVEEFKEYIRAWEGADDLRNLILSQV